MNLLNVEFEHSRGVMSNKRILLSTSKLAKTSPYREVHFSMKIIVYESFFYLLKKKQNQFEMKEEIHSK